MWVRMLMLMLGDYAKPNEWNLTLSLSLSLSLSTTVMSVVGVINLLPFPPLLLHASILSVKFAPGGILVSSP
jgi:hypothetical protein